MLKTDTIAVENVITLSKTSQGVNDLWKQMLKKANQMGLEGKEIIDTVIKPNVDSEMQVMVLYNELEEL